MSNDIGMLIGKVTHAFNITNHGKEKVQVSVTLDFTTSSDADIKSWLASDRTIAMQRPMRSLSSAEIAANYDGQTVLASDVGKKIRSRAERIAEWTNIFLAMDGMDDDRALEMATLAVDNPSAIDVVRRETE